MKINALRVVGKQMGNTQRYVPTWGSNVDVTIFFNSALI